MNKYKLSLIWFFFQVSFANAQFLESRDYIYENKVFQDNTIHTVQLHPINEVFGPPNYYLNQNIPLLLSFDDFSHDVKNYYYTIKQCNHDWTLSDLADFEYLDGFSEGTIRDYDFSFNTTQEYTHFQLSLPNRDMNITKSGNYILIVYEEDIEKVAFTRRFRVLDPRVEIYAEVLVPRMPSLREKYQEISFEIEHEGIDIFNPFLEVFPVVVQNERDDRVNLNPKPSGYANNIIYYHKNMEVAFPSGSEFRAMDLRTLRFRGQGVAEIQVRETNNDIYLLADGTKGKQTYLNIEDLNGKFLIEIIESPRPNVEADYSYVHFFLGIPTKISNGSFYVIGGFNDWKIEEKNKLHYNPELKGYQGQTFLKQGFYNYEYVFVANDGKIMDHSLTEGDFFETENDYSIYLFYRPFGERYDQLIGVRHLNSRF